MSKHTIIIAEAGVNHNGSIELAKQLVDKAVDVDVDYIKFQTFKASKLVTKAAKQAEYQQKNIGKEGDNQYQMLKKLELSPEDHEVLIAYCKEKGIKFFSTAFDFDSIEYLHSLNLCLWKVPSGEVTNYPFLKRVAAYNEKTILIHCPVRRIFPASRVTAVLPDAFSAPESLPPAVHSPFPSWRAVAR